MNFETFHRFTITDLIMTEGFSEDLRKIRLWEVQRVRKNS